MKKPDILSINRRRLMVGTTAFVAAPTLLAQERWPAKPVKMIIPFPPGQATDIYGRLFAEHLGRMWGQTVVVENRPGGGGIIGLQAIKGSPADGYTIGMVSSGPLAINPSIYSKLPYDPLKDFTPISLAFIAPLVLLVNNDVPAKTTADLVALMHKEPDKLSYASGGPGTSQHLACELFKQKTNSAALHIPYKGSGPAMTDLIGGQVQFMIDSVSAALSHIQAGRVRALGVTSATRNPSIPDVPTIAESGVPGLQNFEAVGWAGLVTPVGLPPGLVQKISTDFGQVLRDEAVVQRVNSSGSIVRALPDQQFSKFIANEIEKWGGAARASNTRLD